MTAVEEEVKVGIDKFKSECERILPGVQLVIPVRPTGANFLISLTFEGFRNYTTVHEDDFADWGEENGISAQLQERVSAIIQKLKQEKAAS